MSTNRRVGRVAIVVACSVLVAVGGAIAVVGRKAAHDAAYEFRAPRTVPPPPAPDADWIEPVRGEPTTVVVDGTDVFGVALDEVRALDRASGVRRWRVAVPGVGAARPAVSARSVAVTTDDAIVVLDRATGREVSRVALAGPSSPLLVTDGANDVVIAATEDGVVIAADARTGSPRWRVEFPGGVAAAPVASGGVVVANFVAADAATVRAIDVSTGAFRWEMVVGPLAAPPALGDGMVFVAGGPSLAAGAVRALDLHTGATRWSVAAPGYWTGLLRPVAAGDTLYLVDGLGTATALDTRTGARRWQRRTDVEVIDGPVVLTPTAVVFRSFADQLVVVERSSGVLRSADVQQGVPIDFDASADGFVVALRLGAPSRLEARPIP